MAEPDTTAARSGGGGQLGKEQSQAALQEPVGWEWALSGRSEGRLEGSRPARARRAEEAVARRCWGKRLGGSNAEDGRWMLEGARVAAGRVGRRTFLRAGLRPVGRRRAQSQAGGAPLFHAALPVPVPVAAAMAIAAGAPAANAPNALHPPPSCHTNVNVNVDRSSHVHHEPLARPSMRPIFESGSNVGMRQRKLRTWFGTSVCSSPRHCGLVGTARWPTADGCRQQSLMGSA